MIRRALTAMLYSLMAAVVTAVFLVHPGINRRLDTGFGPQVRGTVARPFCHRALAPALIRAATEATPWSPSLERLREKTIVRGLGIPDADLQYLPWAILFIFACFLAAAYSLRDLTGAFYRLPPFALDAAPALGLLLLPPLFRYQNYLYDTATIALFPLATALIVRRAHPWYYPVLLLAAFNKETAVLLMGVFWLWNRGSMARPKLAVHLVLQAVLLFAAKASLSFWFADRPGSLMEFHLLDHNLVLYHWPSQLAYCVAALLFYGLLVGYRWRDKNGFLRGGLLVTLLPAFAIGVFYGFLDELRIFYETIAFVYLLAVGTGLAVWAGEQQKIASLKQGL